VCCTSGEHPVVVVVAAATVTRIIADITLHRESVIARACKSQSQPPSEARAFLRDAHTHHAQIPSLGSTWIGGIAPFGRAVLELREVQRLENEDVDTLLRTSENGSENEKGSVHSNSSSSSLSKEWGTGDG
jgi:hypothetical protein